MRSWPLLVAVFACASGGDHDQPPGIDACPATATYYADKDGDSHGDGTQSVVACEQPPMTATVGDDCDDFDANRFPGNPEVCDGADNDCVATTLDACPANCTPTKDGGHTYLLCNSAVIWATAQTTCKNAGFHLIQIDTAAENTWVRNAANSQFGVGAVIQLGATDGAAEGSWLWTGSNAKFWQGLGNGTAVGNRFHRWNTNEPNNGNGVGEDCSQMNAAGAWFDIACASAQRFVCERDS